MDTPTLKKVTGISHAKSTDEKEGLGTRLPNIRKFDEGLAFRALLVGWLVR